MTRMGCSSSVHPSIYNETLGREQPRPRPAPQPVDPARLQGDYTQLQVVKHQRQVGNQQRQIRILQEADEMTYRVMEERETLSLGTRSRGTSLNSRATSPTNHHKKSVHFQTEEHILGKPTTENVDKTPDLEPVTNVRKGEPGVRNKKAASQVADSSIADTVDRPVATDSSSPKKNGHKKQKKLKRKTSTVEEESDQGETTPAVNASIVVHEHAAFSPSLTTLPETESHLSRSSSKSDLDSKRG